LNVETLFIGNKTLCDYCNSKAVKRARHKKEKQIEVQATSAEQIHHEGESGDGAQPVVIEEPVIAPVDSREGEKHFLPQKDNFLNP
jgi:DNA-directed RNA polymerase subunit RPC12/RpoP